MPALFVYLLKVNIALLLFCAGYYLVLRHLTFYTLNRIYLFAAILFASVYPAINLSAFLQRHQEIAKPVQAVALNWQAPASDFIKPLEKPDYWIWAGVVLWTGVFLLALRLVVQLYSLYKLYRNSTPAQIHQHDVRLISSDSGPFSFWKSIFINPEKHEPADLQSILLHEQVHVSEWHTVDILLAELSTIFYWFNPGVWLMKKAVRENIEFITDNKILKNGADSKQYQYSLVNVSLSAAPQGIVNHFNISTIKKRIIMMNAKRSSKVTLTRYAFLVPAVVALLLIFGISKAALVKRSTGDVKVHSFISNKQADKGTISITATAKAGTNGTMVKVNVPQQTVIKVADTIKKGKFFLSTSAFADSLNYVINGVKVKKADLDKVDSGNISSVNIVTADDEATKLVDHLNPELGTVFIATHDSEAGKKLNEKINNIHHVRNIASGNNSSASGFGKLVVVDGRRVSAGQTVNSSSAGTGRAETFTMVTSDGAAVSGTLTHMTPYRISTTDDKLKFDSAHTTAYTISVDDSTRNFRHLNTKLYTTSRFASPLTFSSDSKFTLNHLSDKLIIINGKIASQADLKKLPAFDIDRVVLKTDEETKELYGDKAKNGIVFIVTKKK